MSIRQVLRAEKGVESGFCFFGNIRNAVVCIIGRILFVETKGHCVTYTLDDGSGQITARQWIMMFSSPSTAWTVGDYVRVIGLPKEYRDAISISTQHIELVRTLDMISLHWLQAIYIAKKLSSFHPSSSSFM